MITVLIGHRGVGKSSLLKRLQNKSDKNNRELITFDLDAEIIRRENKTVAELFNNLGESGFRKLEEQTFNNLISQCGSKDQNFLIALGAGFSGLIPKEARVVWVRRVTDSDGRIFLDRPRLNVKLSPLEEYFVRYEERSPKYGELSTEEYFVREGEFSGSVSEDLFFGLQAQAHLQGFLTLQAKNFKHWERFINQRQHWGLSAFELRDDLLTRKMFELAIQSLTAKQLLQSYRLENHFQMPIVEGAKVDWALELREPKVDHIDIFSLHYLKDSWPQELRRLEQIGKNKHLKLSPEVNNWAELKYAHEWWSEDPQNRSFLPRSKDGRWLWYRLLMSRKMKMQFLREGEGSALDQPTLAQWLSWQTGFTTFAAILGDPVKHSWTPVTHEEYFATKQAGVLSIALKQEEWCEDVVQFLTQLGLTWAAVTSPLKAKAFALCSHRTERAEMLRSVNTLQLQDGHWWGDNTDIFGAQELIKEYEEPVAVWGGGGTLPVLKTLLPQAQFFSARSGELREPGSLGDWQPQTLVWGVGTKNNYNLPPSAWRPELVIDLNYMENSPGREYALRIGAKYLSGAQMFFAQAEGQRIFWSETK